MKEAVLYTALENKNVKCALCAHRCLIRPGKRGICGVRENRDGVLYSLVYRKLIAQHVDPIEKKPLFHVLPGSLSYSVATVGCNFKCSFCQNADISQMPADMNRITGHDVAPETLVEDAVKNRCRSIAYTYTEPTIYFEYAYDTAVLAEKSDLLNVFVSNGYMTGECLDSIGTTLHAANVDLKSFRDEYYKSLCKARLQPVLDTLKKMKEMGIWIEVTTLLIPGENDSEQEIRDIARFLADLGPEIPWHISRFYPQYRYLSTGPTPSGTVQKARDIGFEEGLKFVYTGNLPGDAGEKTMCPSCGKTVIDRSGYHISEMKLSAGACSFCGETIEGIYEPSPS